MNKDIYVKLNHSYKKNFYINGALRQDFIAKSII